MPSFERLGLGHLTAMPGVSAIEHPKARVARLRERSRGKGHDHGTLGNGRELLRVVPFPTYPEGFPDDVVEEFTRITGKAPLGKYSRLRHRDHRASRARAFGTGRPILYTSADSVFQVAAHEEVIPLAALYDWCERARAMLVEPNNVNRVIARPFVGEPGAFARTPNRRDYAIEPPPSVLDRLAEAGVGVHAVGKICDIYCGHGIVSSVRVSDNRDAMEKTFDLLERVDHGFIFTNLNDFDSKYGHRRNVRGYADALESLDAMLPRLEQLLRPGDQVIFTADHGCDPTAPGTDHTREYVPFVHVGPHPGAFLGELEGLDTVGKAVLEAFKVTY